MTDQLTRVENAELESNGPVRMAGNAGLHFSSIFQSCIFQSSIFSAPLQFYVGVIRPVLQNAVAARRTGLTVELSNQLEMIQKRDLRVIYGGLSFTSRTYQILL